MDEGRKRFWDTFEQMQEDFDRFFEHYTHMKRQELASYRTRWSPPCNVYAADDQLRVLVEIAGMCREALDVRIEEERLILRGSRAAPDASFRGSYQQMEIAFGEFELEIPLAVPVDAEKARAWYQNGFLHIVLPRIPKPKPVCVTLSVPER